MTPPTADQLIVLVTGGSCDIEARYGRRVQRAHYEAGHIGMTAPGQEAALRWEGSRTHSTLQLHLSADARRRVLENFTDRDPALIGLPSALQIVDPVMQHVMLGLFDALRSGAPDLYAETAAEFLIAHVLIRHAGFVPPAPVSPARNRLQRVDEFMRAHLGEPLSLEAIAREAGLSRFHTLRLFKSAFGETPVRPMALTGVTQDRIAAPSTWTVQAPHNAIPHPNFVPVSPRTSRSTHRSGVSSSTSTLLGDAIDLEGNGHLDLGGCCTRFVHHRSAAIACPTRDCCVPTGNCCLGS